MINRNSLLIVLPLAVLISSCSVISRLVPDPTLEDTPTITHQPIRISTQHQTEESKDPITPTSQPAQVPSQAITQTSTPEPILELKEEELSAGGPWLVYRNIDGYLVAIDQDGSGRKVISTEDSPDRLVAPFCLFPSYISPSPIGGLIAYRTALGDDNLKLNIIYLPDGKVVKSFPLLSQENAGSFVAEIVSTPVWSASSRYLAFVGAIEGPSSDLYLYDSQLDTIQQLTDGPNSAGELHWSPDGKWIVHEEILSFQCMRPGWREAKAVWAAAADGSEVKKLYDFPSDSLYQNFLGWLSADRFMVSFENPYDYSNNKVALVDISQGEFTILPYQGFKDIAFAPSENTILFSVSAEENPHIELDNGLYFASLPDGDSYKISDDPGGPVWYPELDHFLVSCCGKATLINSFGEIKTDLSGLKSRVYPSPDGEYIGHFDKNNGIMIYSRSGELIQHIVFEYLHTSYPYDLFWLPDGLGFFFKGESTDGPGFDFFLVEEPGQKPTLIVNDYGPGSYPDAVWVLP